MIDVGEKFQTQHIARMLDANDVVNLNKSTRWTNWHFMRWTRSYGLALGQARASRCYKLPYGNEHRSPTRMRAAHTQTHAYGTVFAVSTFSMNSLQGKRNISQSNRFSAHQKRAHMERNDSLYSIVCAKWSQVSLHDVQTIRSQNPISHLDNVREIFAFEI